MEGVMLRGKTAYATAVRDPQGKIQIESERVKPASEQPRFFRLPVVRGVVNFISSLVLGNKVLMRSADVAIEEEETPSKAEKWFSDRHIDINGVLNTIATVLGVLLAVAIFIWLPQFITDFTPFSSTAQGVDMLWYNLIEGGVRLLVFLLYMVLVAFIPSMKRVYMYHGAEHKTIACVEAGKELTVENVRDCKRFHDRCGTTFLFIVMIISILVFSLANFVLGRWLYISENAAVNKLVRIVFKLLMLPIVAGVSYEILRALAKTDNKLVAIFKFPGLMLQRITTKEPTDDMIACAIAAFEEVEKLDADPNRPLQTFLVQGKMSEYLQLVKKKFSEANIEEDEAEWIFALKLEMPKSAVASEERILKVSQLKEIFKIVDERLTGRPLWYIFGDTDFCGYTLKVDERVLIPRPETEELVMSVVGSAEEDFNILDLCTGSGAIAIAVCKELEKREIPVTVTASDISEDALALAKENAKANGANVKFIRSDMFSRIRDRYHIIVSNPPYIPTSDLDGLQREVKNFEPRLALDGGADGLDYYRKIAKEAPKYLTQGGMVIMEVGAGQATEVVKLFRYADYAIIMKDFAGIDRFVKIVI